MPARPGKWRSDGTSTSAPEAACVPGCHPRLHLSVQSRPSQTSESSYPWPRRVWIILAPIFFRRRLMSTSITLESRSSL